VVIVEGIAQLFLRVESTYLSVYQQRVYHQFFSALPFESVFVESFGRLGAPSMSLLGSFADAAVQAGGPGLSHMAFFSGAFCRGDALCRGTASPCRSGLYFATAASGLAPLRWLLPWPSTEVAYCCLVWVHVPVPVWSLSLPCWVRAGVASPLQANWS
jgi:hypothetical protein